MTIAQRTRRPEPARDALLAFLRTEEQAYRLLRRSLRGAPRG
ncbi:hypothetical protein [Thiohalorhabdus denitrificans]|uniref:Uncharacterized protein n=1 Tax=Thiohalorhabdus denitrificans TaxID=381306 RepID=A0A1G5HUW0_9GAMM|nr:hypothetical protein [Thiohalorhabdus denitrificans]SCY67543.1 hypothetical protein SAMN05661077_0120 [Thiohalorhabdus denitrificans]